MTFRHLKIFVSLYENNFNTTKTARKHAYDTAGSKFGC